MGQSSQSKRSAFFLRYNHVGLVGLLVLGGAGCATQGSLSQSSRVEGYRCDGSVVLSPEPAKASGPTRLGPIYQDMVFSGLTLTPLQKGWVDSVYIAIDKIGKEIRAEQRAAATPDENVYESSKKYIDALNVEQDSIWMRWKSLLDPEQQQIFTANYARYVAHRTARLDSLRQITDTESNALAAGPVVSRQSGYAPPKAIYDVAPEYPRDAKATNLAGKVRARFVIDHNGQAYPRSIIIINSSDPVFIKPVCNAIKASHYQPSQIDGRAEQALVIREYNFNP